jgi:hypothetical protein
MRVAAQQAFRDRRHHVAEVERALLLRHAAEDHLEEEVAQLLAEIVEIAADDGIGHLVGFFQRRERSSRSLLEVPGQPVPGYAALPDLDRRAMSREACIGRGPRFKSLVVRFALKASDIH